MNTDVILGILIPFAGTSLGAAMVFILQKNISAQICESFIGKELEVIVEGRLEDEENVYCGRSYRDCYEIDGFVFFNSSEDLIAGAIQVCTSGSLQTMYFLTGHGEKSIDDSYSVLFK